MSVLAELTRSNVIRMAGLYLVGAWLVVQVGATLLPVFEAPPAIMRGLVAVLAVGFFVAAGLSWLFERTSDGVRRDTGDADPNPRAPYRARRLDRILLVVTTLALGNFVVDNSSSRQSARHPLPYRPQRAGFPPRRSPRHRAFRTSRDDSRFDALSRRVGVFSEAPAAATR